MKLKRFAALALTLAVVLTLVTVPASAALFSDLDNHWSKNDVETVAARGLVKGYTDGTFKPDNKMTYCEALLFCSRATGISVSDKAAIAYNRAEELRELLPADMISWASEEMAVCLETGIISTTELKALKDAGTLSKSITRETLVMYLTRAMQLAPLAESLTSYNMSFSDTSSISPALQPYVYLMSSYGIVRGNESNQFMPKGSLTRGEMATMLRRAVDFMADRGIVTELPEYTTGDWSAGTIASVTSGGSGTTLLTLTSELSGAKSVSLPASAKIYENNMEATTSALKVGEYARVNFNTRGTAISVRLGGTLETYQGTVTQLTDKQITLNAGGTSRMLDIDRFTEVMVGTTVGDRSIIDLSAGYTTAICQVDEMGHLASLRLSGGTREEKGIITAVEGITGSSQVLQVSSFSGVTTRYTIPAGTTITVNGLTGTLNSTYVGKYVSLRLSNDGSSISSVAVDTVTSYVQGAVRSIDDSNYARSITIAEQATGRRVTYDVSNAATVTYEGQRAYFDDIRSGWFVTMLLSGTEVISLECYPGSSTTEGIISGIQYGVTTTLEVTKTDGSVVSFSIDMNDLPDIHREGKSTTIDKLRTGDQVVVTLRYNQVETIEATPQSANVTGTIGSITLESGGVTMSVNLSTGGTQTYKISSGVTVTQDSKAISLYELKPNYQISMVVSGTEVISIEVDKATTSGSSLTGTVIYANYSDRSIIMEVTGDDGSSRVVTVDASGAEFRALSTGVALYFNDLAVGDELQVFGSYSGGTFVATIIIRY